MSAMEPTGEIPSPVPYVEAGGLRFVTMRANLMPDDIIVARRVEALRRKVVIGLGALILIVAAGYAASWLQTRSVQSDLDDITRQNTALTAQQSQYAPLVKAQADAASAQSQLSTLMTGDLPWSTMLVNLAQQAPTGLKLASITGSVQTAGTSSASSGGAAAGNLNESGKQAVGSLTLSGAAPSKAAVAMYSDRLSKVKGLTAPLITSITTVDTGVSFTITLTITTDALGGRFAAPAAAAAGSPAGSGTAPTGGK